MRFQLKLLGLISVLAMAMSHGYLHAQENVSFTGLKLLFGGGMMSNGGTSTSTGSGVYTLSPGTAGFGPGAYLINSSTTFNPNRFVGRAEVGYDWAVNERGIIGLSFSKDLKSQNANIAIGTDLTFDTTSTACTPACTDISGFRSSPSVKMSGPYALALRLGYATNANTMLYAKLFYAQSELSGDYDKRVHGGGFGLGFEANISKHWFARGEIEAIQYVPFDVTTVFSSDFVGTVTDNVKLKSNAARIMIGLRF